MNYSAAVYFAMAIIVPLGLLFDAVLPRHRAVLATTLTAFLFLPVAEIDLGGAYYWNRFTAPFTVIMLGVLFRDQALLTSFRLRWWDLPMILWCLIPGISAISNGFHVYDASAVVLYQAIWIGGPYFIGRLHFRTTDQLRDLAWAAVIGCLIYVPLCWYEIRMSPTLHRDLYGFTQHNFRQTRRGDYFRPMVFMQHGLMASMWIAMGALLAWVLVLSKKGSRILGFPVSWLAVLLTLTCVAMQSFGAVILLLVALATLLWCRHYGRQWPIILLAIMPMVWCGLRTSGKLPTEPIISTVSWISQERAASLGFRLYTEDDLATHMAERPLLGWGAWGRDRTILLEYKEVTMIVDALWTITWNRYGIIGLAAVLAAYLVPVILTFRRVRAVDWRRNSDSLLLGSLALMLAIVMLDNLVNSMMNPLFVLTMGALPTVLLTWRSAEGSPVSLVQSSDQLEKESGPRVMGT